MSAFEYDLSLDDEQRAMREKAHRFAAEVLRPVGIELDRMPADEVAAARSKLRDVAGQAHELGFGRMNGPKKLGGLECSPLTQHLVLEELAWGSLGIASSIFLSEWPPEAALLTGREDLIEEFAAPYYEKGGFRFGVWAITEKNHGSDQLGAMDPKFDVKGPGDLVARRDGDHWILSGRKSAWVSNGPIAERAVVNVHLEPQANLSRSGVFILPLDLPGISHGRALDKHGVRSLPQGELVFEEVRLPRRYVIAEGDEYPKHVNRTLTAFNAIVATLGAGLARAAYEAALEYTKTRVQGGKPIAEHQAVRVRLFRMFSLVRAAHSLTRAVFVHQATQLARGGPMPIEHSVAAKVFATDAAFEVATLAVQLHGAQGMTKDYPAEMFLRDATSFTIADGENAYLSQLAAARL